MFHGMVMTEMSNLSQGYKDRLITAKDKDGNLKTQKVWEWAMETGHMAQTIIDRMDRNYDKFLTNEEITGVVKPRHRPPRKRDTRESGIEGVKKQKFIEAHNLFARRGFMVCR